VSEHASASSALSNPASSFLQQHHFLLRRLHSLSGILPVGVFVMMHLFTNFQLAVGDFQHEVDFIHATPALFFVEVTLWLSIAFHAGLGLVYTFTGSTNVRRYRHGGNVRYFFQRATGMIALVFIFLHIATLRWQWSLGGWFTPFYVEGPQGQPLAQATTALALQYSWWVVVIYTVGMLSVVYHWSNGLWTAAISWGLTISVSSQRRWGYACAGLGMMLTVFSVGAIVGALNYEVTPSQRATVQAMQKLGYSHDHGDHGAGNNQDPQTNLTSERSTPSKDAITTH